LKTHKTYSFDTNFIFESLIYPRVKLKKGKHLKTDLGHNYFCFFAYFSV